MAEAPDSPKLAALDTAPLEPKTGPKLVAPGSVEPGADEGPCLTRLAELGAVFRVLGPIDDGGDCRVQAPLEITALGSGVAIGPKAILSCRTAEALALWSRDTVIPAAQEHLRAVPTEITQSATYACPKRENGASLTEHASGNAVDIGAIGFAHRPPHNLAIATAEEADRRFQTAIQEGSCQYFTTVRAAGRDAAHSDNMHLEVAERGEGNRICDLGGENTAASEPTDQSRD
jgi:hypothetical protein